MAQGIKTGGRQKGTPNKATADVKKLAAKYAPQAMAELGRLATEAESEQARVAAAREILDRAYGKAKQPLVGGDDDDAPLRHSITVEFVKPAEEPKNQ